MPEPVADSVYLVVGNFPPFDYHMIWRGALFESELAAETAFNRYVDTNNFDLKAMPSFVGTIRVDLPAEEGGALSAERLAACLKACDGLPTAMLQGMNERSPGLLGTAYDVCGELWCWHHIDIVGRHGINEIRAGNSIDAVKYMLEEVMAWAREEGGAP